ncbi:hypothetical protein ABK040_004787 [Willaertia magna]
MGNKSLKGIPSHQEIVTAWFERKIDQEEEFIASFLPKSSSSTSLRSSLSFNKKQTPNNENSHDMRAKLQDENDKPTKEEVLSQIASKKNAGKIIPKKLLKRVITYEVKENPSKGEILIYKEDRKKKNSLQLIEKYTAMFSHRSFSEEDSRTKRPEAPLRSTSQRSVLSPTSDAFPLIRSFKLNDEASSHHASSSQDLNSDYSRNISYSKSIVGIDDLKQQHEEQFFEVNIKEKKKKTIKDKKEGSKIKEPAKKKIKITDLFTFQDQSHKFLEKSSKKTKMIIKKSKEEFENIFKIVGYFPKWKLILNKAHDTIYIVAPFPELKEYSVIDLSKFSKIAQFVHSTKAHEDKKGIYFLILVNSLLNILINENINMELSLQNIQIWKDMAYLADEERAYRVFLNPESNFKRNALKLTNIKKLLNQLFISLFEKRIKSISKYDITKNGNKDLFTFELIYVLPKMKHSKNGNLVEKRADMYVTLSLKDFDEKFHPLLKMLSIHYCNNLTINEFMKEFNILLFTLNVTRWMNRANITFLKEEYYNDDEREGNNYFLNCYNKYESIKISGIKKKRKTEKSVMLKTFTGFPHLNHVHYENRNSGSSDNIYHKFHNSNVFYNVAPIDIRYHPMLHDKENRNIRKVYGALDNRKAIVENVNFNLEQFLFCNLRDNSKFLSNNDVSKDEKLWWWHGLNILLQICKTLKYLHLQKHIIHLNINHESVFIKLRKVKRFNNKEHNDNEDENLTFHDLKDLEYSDNIELEDTDVDESIFNRYSVKLCGFDFSLQISNIDSGELEKKDVYLNKFNFSVENSCCNLKFFNSMECALRDYNFLLFGKTERDKSLLQSCMHNNKKVETKTDLEISFLEVIPYISPEYFRQCKVQIGTDHYAFGMLIYYILFRKDKVNFLSNFIKFYNEEQCTFDWNAFFAEMGKHPMNVLSLVENIPHSVVPVLGLMQKCLTSYWKNDTFLLGECEHTITKVMRKLLKQ